MRYGLDMILVVACVLCFVLNGVQGRVELTENDRAAIRADVNEEMKLLHPIRKSTRHSDPPLLTPLLNDRASLLFRALDKNGNKKLEEVDILPSSEHLSRHMPGLSPEDFVSFLYIADKNQDGVVDRDEFMQGINDSLQKRAAAGRVETTLLETDASRRRVGAIGDFVSKVGGNLKDIAGKSIAGLKGEGGIDRSQDGCVLCQYIVERLEYAVKQSGVIPGWSAAQAPPTIFLETSARTSRSLRKRMVKKDKSVVSFLEVAATQPFELGAAGLIGAARAETRSQRQLERIKYNEIYRVSDLALDDVCESSMPNQFYGYCKNVYESQQKVVDGLRYQYRPADICVRIGMCNKSSYLFKGVHSRYRDLPD